MEENFGGAKPKTKLVQRRGETSEPNKHNCSKEKHKVKKSSVNSGKLKSDSNTSKIFINGGIDMDNIDNVDYLNSDTAGVFHDSGIANCNDSISLNDSCNTVKDRYVNHEDSEMFPRGMRKRGSFDDVTTSLPLMPASHLSEVDFLSDTDYRRTDMMNEGGDDINYYENEMENIWKDTYDEKKNDKAGSKNHIMAEKDRNTLKLERKKSDKNAEKILESKKQEVAKRHEESLREKWKKSGLALRKFLSERLGLNSDVKRKKLDTTDKLHKQNSGEGHKHVTSYVNSTGACDQETERVLQHKHTCNNLQIDPNNKQVKSDKKHKADKCSRKDSVSSETSSDKGSKSVLSRFKMTLRSKKKKTENEFTMISDGSYPSSPMSHSSSNNSCTSRLSHDNMPHDHVPRLSCDHQCDQSHDTDVLTNRIEINDNDLIKVLNLDGNDTHQCSCGMCRGQDVPQLPKDGKKCKKLQPSGYTGDAKNKKEKSRRFFRRGKSKKKQYIGILDNELSSLEGGDFELRRHHHKDYTRERLSSTSQDTVTPENTPPRGSTSDVLSGLHFAIPYLPPRLRQRLQDQSAQNESATCSSHGNETGDNVASTNAQNANASKKKKCLRARSSSRSSDKNTKSKSSDHSRLIEGSNLDDFCNLDKDWETVIQSSDRNHSPNQSSSLDSRYMSSSRTNGEISNDSVFSRIRRETNPEIYRNNLIDSLDTPFVPPDTEELCVRGSNSTGTARGDNSLYDFDNDAGLLQDLLDRMDSVSPEDEVGSEGGQNQGRFIPETESETTLDGENNPGSSWFPLPNDESCDEADDEFECDCEHCSLLRQQNTSSDLGDLHDLGAHYEAERRDEFRLNTENELLVPDPYLDEDIFNLNITELTSLDFMLMAESTFRLDIMLENVIQQMLAVQPELLTEHTVPPASQFTIDNLATVSLSVDHIEQNPACPICLCPCELGEIMTVLVCSHLFHPLCINAWLAKSGTCPVCRSPV